MAIKVAINGFGRIGRLVFRALVEQGADRLPDEQLNQIVVGVITAAALAGENGGADPDLASAVADQLRDSTSSSWSAEVKGKFTIPSSSPW